MEHIVINILKSKSLQEEKKAIKNLFEFYQGLDKKLLSGDICLDNSTLIEGGRALSPQHAKDCVNDFVRTARFIKGVYKAISDLRKKHKGKVINILYAGCGPYGTLLIPLLTLFSSEDIQVTLLDIHKISIESVKGIIHHLGYQDYIKEYVVCDATILGTKANESFELIVTETMDVALTKEPQVEITKSLKSLLYEEGVLIPEEIALTTHHSFFAKETRFKEGEGLCRGELGSKKKSKCLFSITKDTVFEKETNFNYESEAIEKGNLEENNPDICIYTNIKIYKDVKLNIGESLITNPYCVSSIYSLKENLYKLRYSTKGIPNWTLVEEKGDS